MAVKLSLAGLAKLGNANGLEELSLGLGENDAQYVLLRVIPKEDTITRGQVTKRTTTMLVVGAEPVTDPADVRTVKRIMDASAAARIDGGPDAEPPLFGMGPSWPSDPGRDEAEAGREPGFTDL